MNRLHLYWLYPINLFSLIFMITFSMNFSVVNMCCFWVSGSCALKQGQTVNETYWRTNRIERKIEIEETMCKIEIERERERQRKETEWERDTYCSSTNYICFAYPSACWKRNMTQKKSFNVKRDKNCKALILSQTKMLHLQAYILYVQEVVTRFI